MNNLLSQLSLFLAIIDRGGLSAAGQELGLSPASVSERLAVLEAYYGVTLLRRTTRSISLTEEGSELADGARRLIEEADELTSRVRSGIHGMSGSVRLSAPVDLGLSRLLPILDRFQAAHPAVTIDLSLTDARIDLVRQGVDFAIRYGGLRDSTLRVRQIAANRRVVCGSPDYLQRYGTPQFPDDLHEHDCLVMRFGAAIDRVWSFCVDGQPRIVTVRGRRVADHGALVRLWALQGAGLCRKSVWDVQADLANGRLVEVLAPFAAPDTTLQIVYPLMAAQPRRVRALIEALSTELIDGL
jgi:DNA-binding transcriptional LysR family regulator